MTPSPAGSRASSVAVSEGSDDLGDDDGVVTDGSVPNIVIAVAVMMGLAFILSLCSTTDAFVAATLKMTFPSQAYEYAAKLGFLVFGPMVDVKLLFMYASIFRTKFVWMLVCGLFLLVGVICSLWSLIPVEKLPF